MNCPIPTFSEILVKALLSSSNLSLANLILHSLSSQHYAGDSQICFSCSDHSLSSGLTCESHLSVLITVTGVLVISKLSHTKTENIIFTLNMVPLSNFPILVDSTTQAFSLKHILGCSHPSTPTSASATNSTSVMFLHPCPHLHSFYHHFVTDHHCFSSEMLLISLFHIHTHYYQIIVFKIRVRHPRSCK